MDGLQRPDAGPPSTDLSEMVDITQDYFCELHTLEPTDRASLTYRKPC